jgi:hypothetical protein
MLTRRWKSWTRWRKPMVSKRMNNFTADVSVFLTISYSQGEVWTKVRVNVWMGLSEKYKLPNDVINCTVILFPSETPDEYNCHANTLKVRTNCLGANMQEILKPTSICTQTNMYRRSHTDLLISKTIECGLCREASCSRMESSQEWMEFKSDTSSQIVIYIKFQLFYKGLTHQLNC